METMEITRRSFLRSGLGAGGVLGCSLVRGPGLKRGALAQEGETVAEIPVVWMATGACTGCSVALLNSSSPAIDELLLGQVLPGKHVSLRFHTTVMASQGEPAMEVLEKVVTEEQGRYLLVVDGATATKDGGVYCSIGEREDGRPVTGYEHVRDLSRGALAVLSVGACAAFGGIPAAPPNPTGAVAVSEVLHREKISTPIVNIPGCPPHPDWIVGSIALLLLGGLEALELDGLGRPKAFFSECVHDNCAYRGHFERGRFAERFGEHGCLIKLGCKGPVTFADCPVRKFNGGTSWCCQAGHPCIGCCHPAFPFRGSLFKPVEPSQLSFPEVYAAAQDQTRRQETDKSHYIAIGLLGAGGFLAGVGVTLAAKELRAQSRKDGTPRARRPEESKGREKQLEV